MPSFSLFLTRTIFWNWLPDGIQQTFIKAILSKNRFFSSMHKGEKDNFLKSINYPVRLPKDQRSNKQFFSCEIIVVAARKDFALLHLTIPYAVKALGEMNTRKITLVTPERDLDTLTDILKKLEIHYRAKIELKTDEQIINQENMEKLSQMFPNRKGWIAQQILKLICCMNSECEYAFVVDADTLILRKRDFVNKNKDKHALFPSEELNSSYYTFLHNFKICPAAPNSTFISHQIFLQPKILIDYAKHFGFSSVDEILEKLALVPDEQRSASSVCIDFEFYAQSALNSNPDSVYLLKWGNVSFVNRNTRISSLVAKLLRPFVCSISFHRR